MITTAELWAVAEIAEHLRVAKSTVHWWQKQDGFPEPVARLEAGAVYDANAVREWRRSTIAARRRARAF